MTGWKLPVGAVLGVLLMGASNAEAGVCPTTTFTSDDATYGGCNFVVQFNADGSINTFAPSGATLTYDGSDDALIGVVNNSGASISSFFISDSSTVFGGIFGGMDGDGINTFTSVSNAASTSLFDPFFNTHGGLASAQGYGGADAYFTGVTATSGTVNFLTAIADGGTDYFSLEQPIDLSKPPVVGQVPLPAALPIALAAFGGFGFAGWRRHSRTSDQL